MATEASRQGRGYARETRRTSRLNETKPSFMTTEFYAMIAAIIGVLVAGQSNDNWDARWVWQLITAIAVGYMVSRGLAKSGTADRHGERDDSA